MPSPLGKASLRQSAIYLRYIVGRGQGPAIGEAAMGYGEGGSHKPYSDIS